MLISTGHKETAAWEAPSIRLKEMETFKSENWQGRIVATCPQMPDHWEVHESMPARSKAYRDVICVPKSLRTPEGQGLSHQPRWTGLGVHLVWPHFPVLAAHLSGLAGQAAGSGLQRSYAFLSSIQPG